MNQLIIKRIQSLQNPEAVRFFFSQLSRLLSELELSPENEKLALNVRDDSNKRFSASLNSRLVLALREGEAGAEVVFMVDAEDYPSLNSEYGVEFYHTFANSSPKAQLAFILFDKLAEKYLTNLISAWLKSCKEY